MDLPLPKRPGDYERLNNELKALGKKDIRKAQEILRDLARFDLYYLLRFILGRGDVWKPGDPIAHDGTPIRLGKSDKDHDHELFLRRERWRLRCFERCRDVQKNPDGRLDLWARGHYKSTIITFALTIQEILRDPNVRIGIFSQDNQTAESHLVQIKRELENNETLKDLFPDVLYARPDVDAPLWSQQKGIIVRRTKNPKEPTLSAYGLVDGLPVGPHFDLLVYDDTVTKDSVRTPEQIRKTTEAWEHSMGLKADGARFRYIGTRYHLNDTYAEILKRGVAIARVFPAERAGKAAMKSRKELDQDRQAMGPTTFASQMMQDPRADTSQGFSAAWIQKTRYTRSPDEVRKGLNVYILGDAAGSKEKDSDYTALGVVGLGADKNFYVLDLIRDKLSLRERGDALFGLVRKWNPIRVGYEQYGLMADIEHFQERMERENFRFPIVKLGGKLPKNERILRLGPIFETGRWWMPVQLLKMTAEGRAYNAIDVFVEEEYRAFPVGGHDDCLDMFSRICDKELAIAWPGTMPAREEREPPSSSGSSWMSR